MKRVPEILKRRAFVAIILAVLVIPWQPPQGCCCDSVSASPALESEAVHASQSSCRCCHRVGAAETGGASIAGAGLRDVRLVSDCCSGRSEPAAGGKQCCGQCDRDCGCCFALEPSDPVAVTESREVQSAMGLVLSLGDGVVCDGGSLVAAAAPDPVSLYRSHNQRQACLQLWLK